MLLVFLTDMILKVIEVNDGEEGLTSEIIDAKLRR